MVIYFTPMLRHGASQVCDPLPNLANEKDYVPALSLTTDIQYCTHSPPASGREGGGKHWHKQYEKKWRSYEEHIGTCLCSGRWKYSLPYFSVLYA